MDRGSLGQNMNMDCSHWLNFSTFISVEHKNFHLNLLQIAWIASRSWLAALLRDGESPVPNYDLRSRVISEKEAWASLQLLLSAKVRPRVNPILQNRIKHFYHTFISVILAFFCNRESVYLIERHVWWVWGCQSRVRDSHAVSNDGEWVGEGRGEERSQVVGVSLDALIHRNGEVRH